MAADRIETRDESHGLQAVIEIARLRTQDEVAQHPHQDAVAGRVERRRSDRSAEQVEPDSQGRIRIPERLLKFAGVKQDVVLLGVNDHVELWDVARWEAFLSEHGPAFDRLVSEAFS